MRLVCFLPDHKIIKISCSSKTSQIIYSLPSWKKSYLFTNKKELIEIINREYIVLILCQFTYELI